LLDGSNLRLGPGSQLIFDCWSEERTQRLNQRVEAQIHVRMFQHFPSPVDAAGLQNMLKQMGYQAVETNPLSKIASRYYQREIEDETPLSWWLVRAEV
jgi:predicted lipid carrier protein YhbT